MVRHGRYYVYMVECATGTYYSGFTKDLEKRLTLHESGNGAKYLRGKSPVRLMYVKEYRYYKNACRAEGELKKLTRKQKEELVRTFMKTSAVKSGSSGRDGIRWG